MSPTQQIYTLSKSALYLLILDKVDNSGYEYRNCIEKIAIVLDPNRGGKNYPGDPEVDPEILNSLGMDNLFISEDGVLMMDETVKEESNHIIDRLIAKTHGDISDHQKNVLKEMRDSKRRFLADLDSNNFESGGAERRFLAYAAHLRAQCEALTRRRSGPSWAPSVESQQDFVMLEPAELLKYLDKETGKDPWFLSTFFSGGGW